MAEKIRVLIIDDEHDLCMVTKFALEGYAGYEVSYETDPRVAAKAAAFTKPDIIVLDIVMPGKDGFAVLDELKRNHYTRSIPVIMYSNLSDSETKLKAIGKYCDCYLEKRDGTPVLKAKIEEVLRLRGLIKGTSPAPAADGPRVVPEVEPGSKIEKAVDRAEELFPQEVPGQEKWERKKILVISEDAEIFVALDSFLVPSGFDVGHCQDMARVVESFEAERPDIVIIDIPLRKIEGMDITNRLKHSKIKSKIIVVTAISEAAVVRDLIHYGADDILIKPYSLEQLYAMIIKNLTVR